MAPRVNKKPVEIQELIISVNDTKLHCAAGWDGIPTDVSRIEPICEVLTPFAIAEEAGLHINSKKSFEVIETKINTKWSVSQ